VAVKKHRIKIFKRPKNTGMNFEKDVMTKSRIQKMTQNYEEWLIASLQDKEEAATYLQVALEEYQKDNDVACLLLALRHVAEAQGGLGKLSRKTHLNRESLYKTLSGKVNPKLNTLGVLLKGLGFQLSIRAI
jgi:probable addiction module antidote protein